MVRGTLDILVTSARRALPYFGCIVLWPGALLAALPLDSEVELAAPLLGSTVERPSSAIWADLDGDGDLDVVGSEGDSTSGGLFWFEYNHSGGFFGGKQSVHAFDGAQVVAAADIDNDGDLDLVASSFFAHKASWFENTAGDASAWTEHAIATGITSADDIITADLDGDGDQDVVVAVRGAGGSVRLYINDGTPAVGSWASQFVGTLSGSGSVSAGDVDRDGDLDLAVSARAGDTVVWYQNGSVALNSWTEFTIETFVDAPIHTRLADMDGDGDLDAVVTARTDDDVLWYENDGDPTDDVADWAVHTVDASFDGPYLAQPADYDRDGDMDLLVSADLADEIRSYENLDGSGTNWKQQSITTGLDGARWAIGGDHDNDGDADVVAVANGAASDDKILFFENLSLFQTGAIASRETVWHTPGDIVTAAAAGDLDGDGDIDLVGGGDLTWFENTDRVGTEWVTHDLHPAFSGRSARVADFDRDGDLDVLAANGLGGSIHWYENDGSPADDAGGGLGTSWTEHVVESSALSAIQDIAVADINGDGAPDILATANLDDLLLWWENDGTPADDLGGDGNSWTERTIAASPDTDNARTLRTGDIDGDGDIDVISVAQQGERASWWANNGTGTSWTVTQIASGFNSGAAIFDFDNDGDLDLATSEGIADSLTVATNTNGNGATWQPGSQLLALGPASTAEWIVAEDFDQDGDTDIALAIESDDRILWAENPGSLPWIEHSIDTVSDGPVALTVADIDGDGDGDLIAGIRNDNELVWYRNESGQFALTTFNLGGDPEAGDEKAMLDIVMGHRGRAGDAGAELATLELLLEETSGDVLSDGKAQALFDAINVYADANDSGDWDVTDPQLAQVTTFLLDDGVLEIVLPDDSDDLDVAVGETERLFVTAALTATAGQAPPTSFRITHLTSSSSRGEDDDFDTGLRMSWAADVSTTLVVLVDCYELSLGHTGFGTDPAPDIANSTGCPAGTYVENQEITLTASPDQDYAVGSWNGTDDNGSTATVNTVTMPAMAHAASVNYVFPDHIVISNETVIGSDNREACLTVTAGPNVSVQNGIVTFRAADGITLQDGFTVNTGTVFNADLDTPSRCVP